jgi:3-hydroxypropanoate dehydrogenase
MGQPLDDAALDQLFRTARTYNGYLDRPVSPEQLHAIWDLMKFGPTSANMLPARLVWCTTPEAKETLAALAGGTNGGKIRKAPATVIIGMDVDFTSSCIGFSRTIRASQPISATAQRARRWRSGIPHCKAAI